MAFAYGRSNAADSGTGTASQKTARLWKLGLLAAAAALGLDLYPILCPMIVQDDLQILARSRTWAAAWSNLWSPANEHVMPLGRLLTAAWLQLAGKPTLFPRVIALQGPFSLLLALILLFLFIQRELDHPFYGLVAVIFFGVTSLYHQAVGWFAASFSILCLDQTLLALLAAQQWERSGRRWWLLVCAFNCALAPAWFASGVLAGPFCVLYLLFSRRGRSPSCLLPLLGPAVFLAMALPHSAGQILHLAHYEGQTTWDLFDLRAGVVFTGRSLVDNLGLGAFGISSILCPAWLVAAGLVLCLVLLIWWWRPVSGRRLLWVGLAFVLCNYVLTYSARAAWGYDAVNMAGPAWGRYHLFPQMGLVFLLCGGLTRWQGVRFSLLPSGDLGQRQAKALAGLIAVLFILHLPRGLLGSVPYESQTSALARVERVDNLCQVHHISAETARAVLPPLCLPLCHKDESAWELLRGSNDPRDWTLEEARALLAAH
jgi:hypothetical protein